MRRDHSADFIAEESDRAQAKDFSPKNSTNEGRMISTKPVTQIGPFQFVTISILIPM
jgi:hypothetical protein